MFGNHVLRMRRRRTIHNLVTIILALLVIDLLIAVRTYSTCNQNLVANTIHQVDQLPTSLQGQKIFIVAQFWTSADVLRDHWQDALLELIDLLGVDNVYVSIVATKGLDDTNAILQRFEDEQLAPRNIPRTIILDSKTHEDEIKIGAFDGNHEPRPGWLYTGDSKPPGQKEMRRIPYLAGIRNRSLEPLHKLQQEEGIKFDKILFLGDVIFKPADVLTLLATNQGSYDVACSIDYRLDKRFYDTFVLRDANFDVAVTRYFPIFGSSISRNALLKGLPVPVTSCWNGMVVTDAVHYYYGTAPIPEDDRQAVHDLQIVPGLSFRGIPDSLAAFHVEGSEACLIHADAIAQGRMTKGLFMNPAVRVGYTRWGYKTTAYDDVHIGADGLGWVTLREYVQGIWINRRARWNVSRWWSWSTGKFSVQRRVEKWKSEGKKKNNNNSHQDRIEPGEYCLIDEMQILTSDGKGWKHVGQQAQY